MELRKILASLDPEVRNMFAEDAPAGLTRARSHLERGEHDAAWREVHSFHGAALFCGLKPLAEKATMLETYIKEQQLPEITAACLDELEMELNRVVSTLRHGTQE